MLNATGAGWIVRANIERFERLLKDEVDPQKIKVLRELLSEEQKKLANGSSL